MHKEVLTSFICSFKLGVRHSSLLYGRETGINSTDTLISNFHDFSLRWNFSPDIEWGISSGSGLPEKGGGG